MARKTAAPKPLRRSKATPGAEAAKPKPGFETGAAGYATVGLTAAPARLHGKPFHCLACGGSLFYTRHSLLNTMGLTLLDWEALNREATNLICHDCGYIHWFTIP